MHIFSQKWMHQFFCDSSHSYLYADYLSGQWELSDSNAPTEIKGGVYKTASKRKESKHLQESMGPPHLILKSYIRSNYAQTSSLIHTQSFKSTKLPRRPEQRFIYLIACFRKDVQELWGSTKLGQVGSWQQQNEALGKSRLAVAVLGEVDCF